MSIAIGSLTGNEQAVLLVLMAENRSVPNPELAQLGPKLEKTSRDTLLRHKLIEVTPGRPMSIVLSDDGWAVCRQIIEAAVVPPQPSSQGKALYTLLRSLQRYFAAHGLVPATVFGDVKAAPNPVALEHGHSESEVKQEVRTAYHRLAAHPGAWVRLAALRHELAQIPRAEVDIALRQLYRTLDVSIIPEADQKTLTPADREAAIVIGDQDKHVFAIDS